MKTTAKRLLLDCILVRRLPRSCPNSVLFTFDDGPSVRFTPPILDLLDLYHVRACFFVVGAFAAADPGLVRDIRDRGHLIGNHTYSHQRSDLGFRSFADDVYRCQSTIREITGIDARLVRPPLGRPTVGGAWASIRLGARLVHWSVEGGEWGFAKSQPSGEIGRRLAREIKGRDIILLHDDNEKTLSVLEIVLPALREGGLDLGSGVQGLIAR